MVSPTCFQANPQVVSETIEGEVIAINLETGCYYSLTGVASEVWALLQQRSAAGDLIETLLTRYEAEAGEIETAVASFVHSLQSEGLIVPTSEGAALAVVAAAPTAARAPFAAPTLQKYDDMRDLLLIDPIHEVGEAGWPMKAPEQREG